MLIQVPNRLALFLLDVSLMVEYRAYITKGRTGGCIIKIKQLAMNESMLGIYAELYIIRDRKELKPDEPQ